MTTRPRCLVSVDLEEWSDALLARIPAIERDGLSRSLEAPVERLLDLLERNGARATFFVLGRVARRCPGMIRRIALTHEIASHGQTHEDLRDLDAKGLASEIQESRRLLEDLTGTPVRGYRAPNWSLAPCFAWAAPVLADCGVLYDSSLIPGRGLLFAKGHAGLPGRPHRLEAAGGIWEFPPTAFRLPGLSLTAAGGAFLRALPLSLVLATLRRADAAGEIPHVHLHPWELHAPWEIGRLEGRHRLGALRSRLLFHGAMSTESKLGAILSRYRGWAIDDARLGLEAAA